MTWTGFPFAVVSGTLKDGMMRQLALGTLLGYYYAACDLKVYP